MKKVNKQFIIIPSLILSLVIGWVIMIYLPAHEELRGLNKQLRNLEEKEKQIVAESRIRMMRAKVDSLATNLDSRLKRFYPEGQLLDIGRMINEIVERNSLRLISITPDYDSLSVFKDEKIEVSQLPITIELKGGFNEFTQFLDGISDCPFVLHFREVTLGKEDVAKPDLDIVLEGIVGMRKVKPLEKSSENMIASNTISE